jgi:hypothetical protein
MIPVSAGLSGTRSGPPAPDRAGNRVRVPVFEVSLLPSWASSEALQWHFPTILTVERVTGSVGQTVRADNAQRDEGSELTC